MINCKRFNDIKLNPFMELLLCLVKLIFFTIVLIISNFLLPILFPIVIITGIIIPIFEEICMIYKKI